MPEMLIIMPCYKGDGFTKQAIQSIEENTENHHFLFVDNGSQDLTSHYMRQAKNKTIIRNDCNKYVNYAWNQGLQFWADSDFEYACILNNDILVGHRWLDPIFEAFTERTNEYYLPNSDFYKPEEDIVNWSEFMSRSRQCYEGPMKKTPAEAGWCLFLRKKFIPWIYPIDVRLNIWYGDNWIKHQLREQGIQGYALSRCTVFHYGQVTLGNMGWEGITDILATDRNNWETIKKEHGWQDG